MRLKAVLLVSLGCVAAAMLSAAPRHTMLMNRLGPSAMTLYLANADGSDERPLFQSSGFDYNASFSPDGRWIVFMSERDSHGDHTPRRFALKSGLVIKDGWHSINTMLVK